MARERRYLVLMGICLSLIILAWFVVRFFSITAAVAMSAVAAFIPPIAAIVGNRSDAGPTRQRPRRHRW